MTMTTITPCPTCSRTYGAPVDIPGRCGVCLTGLSLDGHPIFPTRTVASGRWLCPCCGGEAIRLSDGTFMHAWTDGLLGVTTEEMADQTAADRAAGIW